MEGFRSGYVDIASKDVNQVQTKPGQVKQGSALLKFDEKVHVALSVCFAPCDGAEDTCPNDSSPTHDVCYLIPNLCDRWTHKENLVKNQDSAPFRVTNSSRTISVALALPLTSTLKCNTY